MNFGFLYDCERALLGDSQLIHGGDIVLALYYILHCGGLKCVPLQTTKGYC